MKRVFSLLIIFLSIIICSKVYAYKSYKIGDKVTYNDIDFYVIKDSSQDEDYVILLKKEPLTVDEVNLYGGVGTANNHVNMYNASSSESSYQTAYDNNGYGGMAYYTSETCGYLNNEWVETGCKNDYASSEIKYVVDAWKAAKAPAASEARLLTYDEYTAYAEKKQICTGSCYEAIVPQYDWMYNNNYLYWLGTPYTDSSFNVWYVSSCGLYYGRVNGRYGVVRPVITISKSALPVDDDNQDNEIIDDNNKEQSVIDNTVESNTKVNVPNTLKSISGLIILIGLVLICVGLNLFIIVKNRSNK